MKKILLILILFPVFSWGQLTELSPEDLRPGDVVGEIRGGGLFKSLIASIYKEGDEYTFTYENKAYEDLGYFDHDEVYNSFKLYGEGEYEYLFNFFKKNFDALNKNNRGIEKILTVSNGALHVTFSLVMREKRIYVTHTSKNYVRPGKFSYSEKLVYELFNQPYVKNRKKK